MFHCKELHSELINFEKYVFSHEMITSVTVITHSDVYKAEETLARYTDGRFDFSFQPVMLCKSWYYSITGCLTRYVVLLLGVTETL